MPSPSKIINDIIRIAWVSELDISHDYHREAPDRIHQLQSELIRVTREIYSDYVSFFGHTSKENEESLYALRNARQALQNHPFKHVIDGRIAEIVQHAMKKKEKVPPEFIDDYLFFEFQPWNNPFLNYYSVEDLIKNGRKEAIPPEYR